MLLIIVFLVIGVPVGSSLMARCDGALDAALDRANGCPEAQVAFGGAVDGSFLGLTCGSSERAGAFAQASWSTPISGPAGRGTLQFAAEKRGGDWRVLMANVEIGEAVISVVPCGPGGEAQGVDALGCDQGDGAACNRVGVAFAKGAGVELNVQTAERYYQRACDADYGVGCSNLGALYAGHKRDPRGAVHFYRLGCEKHRSSYGCTLLSDAIRRGNGVAADPARARALAKEACDAGYQPGCGRLGDMMARGEGGPPEPAGGRVRVKAACDGGDPPSCAMLGWLNLEGLGAPRDTARAMQLWLGSCDAGESEGCAALWRYHLGAKDHAAAKRYRGKACLAGDSAACDAVEAGP